MKFRNSSIISASTALVTVMLVGAATPGLAQTTKTPPAKMPEHQDGMKDMKGMKGMKGMDDMKGMIDGPHAMLAMAYRDNLMTFGRALKSQIAKSKTVDVDLARPATVEMRRSYDQMRQHHQAQSSMMGTSTDAAMMTKMKDMDAHLAAVDHHLSALETEVKAGTPDPKKVLEHLNEALKECEGMSSMHAKAKPHQMK